MIRNTYLFKDTIQIGLFVNNGYLHEDIQDQLTNRLECDVKTDLELYNIFSVMEHEADLLDYFLEV